jgi:tryptophan-rich sensory protein
MFQNDLWLGVLFGLGNLKAAFVAGLVLGLIPLVLGQCLGQARFGRTAAIMVVVATVGGGALVGLPVCLVFAVDTLRRWWQKRAKPALAAGCRVRVIEPDSGED